MLRHLLAASLFIAAPALADPVEGTWKTEPGDTGAYGLVEMKTCGDRICGTMIATLDAAGAPVESSSIGKRIVWDMEPGGAGAYGGGKIWAPDRDKTYNSKMSLDGDSLSVSGCILILCRAQTWTRIE